LKKLFLFENIYFMSDESATLTKFISITGADTEVARQYLLASNWECATAVDRFYTNPPVSGQNLNAIAGEEEVRSPIAATFDTLVGSPARPLPWMSDITAEQPRSTRDWGASWQANSGGEGKSLLADLFKSPEYRFSGTLQEACRRAEQENKAVIVNIQSVQVFDSHLLNRDVWTDAVVKQIIDHNFVFCQWDAVDSEGSKYIQFYNCFDLPHLAILNPSIRKEMVTFSDKKTCMQVQEVLLGYLERDSSSKKRSLPEPISEARNASMGLTSTSIPARTDEDMLQAGIQASLADYKEEIPHLKNNVPTVNFPAEKKPIETVPSIPPEPEISDETTNLSVQFPDGSKRLRRFCLDSKARLIYDWCARESNSNDFKLSIRFPRKVLKGDDFCKTLRELGLRNMQLFLTKEA